MATAALQQAVQAVKIEGPSVLLPRFKAIFDEGGLLDKNFVERKEESKAIELCTLAGVDLLFIGPPGVGKSQMIETFSEVGVSGSVLFSHMIFKEGPVDEIIGPRSVKALKEDELLRIVEGFLPTANFAILDEIFKGPPTVLNALLDVFAKRELRVGGKPIKLGQLVTILMASNELPEREDLQPFRDRIAFTKTVEPVQTPQGRKRVREIQLGQIEGGSMLNGVEPLTLEEIMQARAEVEGVELPEAVGLQTDDMQDKCMKEGHEVSQRRMKSIYKVMKANAWANGRNVCTTDDMIPAQHMVWNLRDHEDSARDIVLSYVGEYVKEAETIRKKLTPAIQRLDDINTKVKEEGGVPSQEVVTEGMSALRDVAEIGSEARKLVEKGEKSGQDVTALQTLVTQAKEAHEWGQKALLGQI